MALSQGRTESAPRGLSWRPMTLADIDAVFEIALISFPDYFEGRECFENRLALNPSGCFVLAQGESKAQGYLVAYPWLAGAAPGLNTLIGALPAEASVMYLQDMALLPQARRAGWSGPMVERLAAETRAAGWADIALIAVNGAAPFWERHDFAAMDAPALVETLAGYGPDARYMVRRL